MASFREIDEIVTKLKSGAMNHVETREFLKYRSPIVRANALSSIANFGLDDDATIDAVASMIDDPANHVALMGTITVVHLAIGCLLRLPSVKARTIAMQMIAGMNEPERSDLMWYLRSEGLGME